LEEAQAHLAEMVGVDEEELKKQVVAQAKKNRKIRLSSSEAKL